MISNGGRTRQRTGVCLGALVVVASVLVAPLFVSHAVSAQVKDDAPRNVAELLEAFDITDEPADYVVIVDTSGSMSTGEDPPFPAVREAYASFIGAIGTQDHLSVITFSGRPAIEWNAPVPDDAARRKVIGKLPEVANGENTDIGAALAAGVDRLERPDANAVQVVIFLTDGQHQPGGGSLFPAASGPEWDKLRDRVATVDETHSVVALGAGIGQSGAAGVNLLTSVFPNAQVSSLPADQLEGFFEESVQKGRLAQLEPLVRRELEEGGLDAEVVDAPEIQARAMLEVELTSRYPHLPVDVTLGGVQVTGPDTKVRAELIDPPSTFRLGPGGKRTVQVEVTGLEVDHSHDRSVGSFSQSERLRVELDTDLTVQPEEQLGLLFPGLPDGPGATTATATLQRESGITWVDVGLAIIAAAVLAAILYGLYWRFIQVPPLVGLFLVSGQDDVITLRGKDMKIPGRKAVLPAGSVGAIEVFTKRARRKKVFVRPLEQPVEHKPRAVYAPLTEPKRLLFNEKLRLGSAEIKYVIATKGKKKST